MRFKNLLALLAFFNCIFATLLQAQAPQMFRYQGRILDNDVLVSGNLEFSFKLYDSPTGGSSLYTDTGSVTVVDGLYSTMVGDDTSSGGDLGAALNNPAVYLEIVAGGETLTPRERIVSVPYAMNSSGSPTNSDGQASGTIELSTSNPNEALESDGYSLMYSDSTLVEDWAWALQTPLNWPSIRSSTYVWKLLSFGDYVGVLEDDMTAIEASDSLHYTTDGLVWYESDLPAGFMVSAAAPPGGVYTTELNGALYILQLYYDPATGTNFNVASTSNGKDWTTYTTTTPSEVQFISSVVAYADQLWLFGTNTNNDAILLKSSDGATWTAGTTAWNAMQGPNKILVTPERVVVMTGDSTNYTTWTTVDGNNWDLENFSFPGGTYDSGNAIQEPFLAYANSALWTLGNAGGMSNSVLLYKSTDWGTSWSQVTAFDGTSGGSADLSRYRLDSISNGQALWLQSKNDSTMQIEFRLSVNGSDWILVGSVEGYSQPQLLDQPNGQTWLGTFGDGAAMPSYLYSIGGPLRNGRFFHYQKD